jgi:hypothetical protein
MTRLHILKHGHTLCGIFWPDRPPHMTVHKWVGFDRIDEAIEAEKNGDHEICEKCRSETRRLYMMTKTRHDTTPIVETLYLTEPEK